MRDLDEVRVDIDEVDKSILALYEKRLKLADEVAEYKIANHKNVYDKKRELEKLDKLSSMAADDFTAQGIRELFEQIMSCSRKKQYQILANHGLMGKIPFEEIEEFDFSDKTIVYQGVEGAYSQAATIQFFGNDKEMFHVDTWREAMEAIKTGMADFAVLPIENSTAGSVIENYDLLMEYDVTIVGEQIIKVEHALLGLKEAKLSDIDTVYSHPQALMQCDHYLLHDHPEFEAIAVDNTAMAAKRVCDEKRINQAAIASPINAELYGLKILDEAIQDDKQNETRFIIVSGDKKFLSNANKVSLCIELSNDKGSLYHMLSHFIFNGLSLSKIESRPIKGKQWEYRFFIDFDGNLREEAVLNALRGLQEETNMMRILGNY